jgi:hypothetical protein
MHFDGKFAQPTSLARAGLPQGFRPCCYSRPPMYVDAPPEVTGDALTGNQVRESIRSHGSLVVRELISPSAVERLRTDIDSAFDCLRLHRGSAATSRTAPWYTPFQPPNGESLDIERWAVETSDGVLAADSPRTMSDLVDAYEQAGLRDVVSSYLGDRPMLTVKKTTLRRIDAETDTPWWHQDGAFLGQLGALNIWLSLSHCGDDAPSLDIAGRRFDYLLPSGTEGAQFDWSIGQSVVDRHAAGTIVRPRFAPGDALLFDEMLVHRTGVSPEMRSTRYAIESWFFACSNAPVDRIPVPF